MPAYRYVTYGDYASGYCEDWTPTGSPALFTSAGATFAPSRLPGYPTYVMSWIQATAISTGADTIAYAPYVQELLIQLPWVSFSGADKASLEAFFKSVTVNGMSGEFSLSNPMSGLIPAVRFATAVLAAMPEIAYDRYQANLTLRISLNYPQLATSGPPPIISGNRFVIGGIAMPFPIPVRPSTGYGITKPQTIERNTAGSPVIYNKSQLTLQQHKLVLVLDYGGFIRLQAFFFSYTHGQRYKFTWYDQNETARSVRLVGTTITIKQTGYNRYETEINLVEEI